MITVYTNRDSHFVNRKRKHEGGIKEDLPHTFMKECAI